MAKEENVPADGTQNEGSLAPDLGTDIGSRRWWRDAFFFSCLVALLFTPLFLTTGFPPAYQANRVSADVTSQEMVERQMPVHQAEVQEAVVLAPEFDERSLKVSSGDTLMELVSSLGVPRTEAFNAIEALSDVYNPRKLRVGQDVVATLGPMTAAGGPMMLAGLSIRPEPQVTYVVLRNEEGGYDASANEIELRGEFIRATGVITSSLYETAQEQGMSQQSIVNLIRIFSYDVDFQREIRVGDRFDVMYERFRDEDGVIVKDGEILFGNLILRGEHHALYRYTPSDDGIAAYFDENGNSTKKLLMRTPIDGARLTSRFGNRRHPTLGYMKQHRGIDFGAGRGTPIMAAGNGVIEYSARNGSYGNYVRIRHNGTYKTAYAHMNGFASGIKKGRTVEQGQIIGYVGSTGRSTGPHLHYEVLINDKRVNPLDLDLPTGRKLEDVILADFMTRRMNTDTLLASLSLDEEIATLLSPADE